MSDAGSLASIERRSSYDMRDPFGGDDSKQIVKFLNREVIDEVASKEADRLVYVGCDYISIRHPGERDEILRPVRDSDKKRWSKQWQAFEAGATQAPSGTPLSVLFPRNPRDLQKSGTRRNRHDRNSQRSHRHPDRQYRFGRPAVCRQGKNLSSGLE